MCKDPIRIAPTFPNILGNDWRLSGIKKLQKQPFSETALLLASVKYLIVYVKVFLT